jgi:signal transduction histidine kinase
MNRSLIAVLVAGFGCMTVLTAILGFTQARSTTRLMDEFRAAHENYDRTSALLNRTAVDMHQMGIDIRDYLLDRDLSDSQELRDQLIETRERVMASFDRLAQMLPEEARSPLAELRRESGQYFDLLAPVLTWDPQVKASLGAHWSRQVLLKRRQMIANLSSRIQRINEAHLRSSRGDFVERKALHERYVLRLTIMVLFVSAFVAVACLLWIARLESQAHGARNRAEQAERELRRLSQQLVQAQEEERKSLSRELHDEIGQTITGLRMEISNLGRIPPSNRKEFEERLRSAKSIAEQLMKNVRDLAMGLRPAILDDLGLAPAIEWQAREFSRRTGVPANVSLSGELSALDDRQKTALFRIVQEALTNVARHAKASAVNIRLDADDSRVLLEVNDDGKGIADGAQRPGGLGLLGIEERARELGGAVAIHSGPGAGTRLEVELPRSLS